MITALDSSVLWAILKKEAGHEEWLAALLRAASNGPLIISPIAFAELAPSATDAATLNEFLGQLAISYNPITPAAAHLAGLTFKRYRQAGGPRMHLVPDFVIAAHAQVRANRLAAIDRGYLRQWFPELLLPAHSRPEPLYQNLSIRMSHSFIDNDLLSRLGSLPIESRAPMLGNVAGKHRSPHRGSSVEFAEYRKYVPGDDTRRLDWKAFARSDRFYIKEFEADTNLRAYFVVDASGSMKFAGTGETKIQYARRIAASLAYLLVNQGDAAGLSICTDKLHLEVPPSRRAAHLERFFSTLGKLEPSGETGLIPALHTIAEKIGQRAFVVILSDLFTDSAALGEALQHLRYRKHDISVFHLMDSQEIGFEFDRPHRFVDMEDGTALVAEPNLIADEYKTALREFLTKVRAKCHAAAADYQLVTTDSPLEPLLRDFLTARLPKSKH
ncbi:MAG: DUF58 domain-containing protein [Luteolibacter sp.]|jgi:predicted nucleic acid-binding protein|nr:DUF58 domain-containing protein [Luteolibacter sp.]